jgi:hypothetical protein
MLAVRVSGIGDARVVVPRACVRPVQIGVLVVVSGHRERSSIGRVSLAG